jgi:hypothetical protein
MNLNAGLKDPQQQQNPLNLGTDRPLNLAGFIKPKPSHKHQNKAQLSPSITGTPLKSRGSIEGVQRPMKPAALPKKQGTLKLRLSNSSTEKNQKQNGPQLQNQDVQASPFFSAANSTPTSGFFTKSLNSASEFTGPQAFQINSGTKTSERRPHIPILAQAPSKSPRPIIPKVPLVRSTLDNISESSEHLTSPFGDEAGARTSLSDPVDFCESPASPGAGVIAPGFSVSVSGEEASVGHSIAVESRSGSVPGHTKRKHVHVADEDDAEEGAEHDQASKRWKGNNEQVRFYLPPLF